MERQIAETCEHRDWKLHAVNCRSNHMHAVVTAPNTTPTKVRIELKSWCTRRLKDSDPTRAEWWTDRGSVRWVFDEESLATVMQYVNEAQDRMDRGK